MDNNENNGFSYTYSAREQAELKKIRARYVQEEKGKEDKMSKLRRLDREVTQKAQCVSLIVGVIGALLLGTGMSLAMSEISEILGTYRNFATLYGSLIGIPGCVMIALAYPVYNFKIKQGRKKIAPEIIRLTDELMK